MNTQTLPTATAVEPATPALVKAQKLAQLEEEFAALGGRSVWHAEEIDALRAELEVRP